MSNEMAENLGDIQFDIPNDDNEEIRVLVEGIDEIPAEAPSDPRMGKTKEELLASLNETQRQLEAERQNSLNSNALKGIVDELKTRPIGGNQAPNLPPQETEEEFKKKFNSNFYDSPYDTMMEFQAKKLAPEVQRIMQSNMSISRKLLMMDPDRKETATKYQAEIDDQMSRISPSVKLSDPDIYQKVHDQVISYHIREIIDSKVKEVVASQGKGNTVNSPARPAGYSEKGTAPGGGKAPAVRTLILSRKEADTATRKGMGSPEGKVQYAQFLLRHPEFREK